MRKLDASFVAVLCLALFGYVMFGGRALTMHEGRLPETAREMQANHDWLIPRSGGRPWLERAPLPHWIVIALATVMGQTCDRIWIVRFGSVLMGCATVLLAAYLATRWFGRGVGLAAGLLLATAYEFYRYSTLAEEDIYLAFIVTLAMTLFAQAEFFGNSERLSPIGWRSWPVVGFFVAVGLSNWIKSPLLGPAMVLPAVGVFLVSLCSTRLASEPAKRGALLRWCWLWGWLILIGLALAWPRYVYHRYPSVLENWRFDYTQTTQYDQPWWYYAWTILWVIAPWTPGALVGLWKVSGPAKRFLWCWAIVPVIVLSLSHRKGHHYLVPVLAPWCILAAVGFVHIGRWLISTPMWGRRSALGLLAVGLPGAAAIWLLHKKIPAPPFSVAAVLIPIWLIGVGVFYYGLKIKRPALMLASCIAGICLAYCWQQTFLADENGQDTAFLLHVPGKIPDHEPLFIDAATSRQGKTGELDFFRSAFYLPAQARLLHNLTFLRDQTIHEARVCVVARAHDFDELSKLGKVRPLDQSLHTRRETSAGDRLALFELQFKPDLQRYPAPSADEITVMQAMGRAKGPYCGPPDNSKSAQ